MPGVCSGAVDGDRSAQWVAVPVAGSGLVLDLAVVSPGSMEQWVWRAQELPGSDRWLCALCPPALLYVCYTGVCCVSWHAVYTKVHKQLCVGCGIQCPGFQSVGCYSG